MKILEIQTYFFQKDMCNIIYPYYNSVQDKINFKDLIKYV
jgi:hypothetical protein